MPFSQCWVFLLVGIPISCYLGNNFTSKPTQSISTVALALVSEVWFLLFFDYDSPCKACDTLAFYQSTCTNVHASKEAVLFTCLPVCFLAIFLGHHLKTTIIKCILISSVAYDFCTVMWLNICLLYMSIQVIYLAYKTNLPICPPVSHKRSRVSECSDGRRNQILNIHLLLTYSK